MKRTSPAAWRAPSCGSWKRSASWPRRFRNGTHEERVGEFADVLAWLTTIANVAGVDLTQAVLQKYGAGCPGCGRFVCSCPVRESRKKGIDN